MPKNATTFSKRVMFSKQINMFTHHHMKSKFKISDAIKLTEVLNPNVRTYQILVNAIYHHQSEYFKMFLPEMVYFDVTHNKNILVTLCQLLQVLTQ